MANSQHLAKAEKTVLFEILKKRFEKNTQRHPNMKWEDIQKKIEAKPNAIMILNQMELTGGEPDVVQFQTESETITFCDCAPESPKGRRSYCYDRAALDARKTHKPTNSAIEVAAEMGIEILTEEEYRKLQEYGDFDLKTSSWIKTPEAVRQKGGAIFCDKRYGRTFTYHNGAESYYASRAFRGKLNI